MFSKIKKIIFILAGIIFLSAIIIVAAISRLFSRIPETPTPLDFTISPGSTISQIANQLEEQKIINNARAFQIYLRLGNNEKRIKAGDYIIEEPLNIKQLTGFLVRGGKLRQELTITILEGWRNQEIGAYLEEKNIASQKDFQRALADIGKYNLGLRPPQTLEGFLFPDTYKIFTDATAQDIIDKMVATFKAKITPQMRSAIKQQGKTLHEIITMASIIEKEVRTLQDKKIVSGIFWNRIGNRQALQSCATLSYILGENKPQYSIEDTQIPSPYNTYQNLGLPPGPICNPGLDSIMAAIYPTDSNYNYFLNRFDNGETVFSVTFDEHVRNKNKYLK